MVRETDNSGTSLLREIYQKTLAESLMFAPPKIEIPAVTILSANSINDYYADRSAADPSFISPLKDKNIYSSALVFLMHILTIHDSFSRPYHITDKADLINVLYQVDPQKRKWSQILTQTLNKLNTQLSDSDTNGQSQVVKIAEQVQGKYNQDFPGFASLSVLSFNLVNPKGHRFTNPQLHQTIYDDAARQAEKRHRLSPLLPPHDPDEWLENVLESVEMELMPEEPEALNFTDSELIVMGEMFEDFVESLKHDTRTSAWKLKVDFPSLVGNHELWKEKDIGFDPSMDHVEWYHFCLRLAHKKIKKDGKNTLPKAVESLLEIINSYDRLDEFIKWVADGDKLPIPLWLLDKERAKPKGEAISQTPSASGILPKEDLVSLPDREIYFLEDYEDLPNPNTLDAQTIDRLIENGKIILLPLKNLTELINTVQVLIPRPYEKEDLAERVVNAVTLLAQYSWEKIIRCPENKLKEHGRLHPWVRKLVAAKRTVGIYGVIKKINGREIIIISTVIKKELRD